MQEKKQTLLLLDGNAIIHRAYHALPPLTAKDGRMVNAVYGFCMTLLSVLEKFHPTHVVASFDLSGPTFRHKVYEGYKAKRVKAPDELYLQIPLVKDIVRAFNISIYEKQGFEADDMIGSVACLASRVGNFEVIIVTGDADALQLVNDDIKVFTMRKGIKDTVLFDRDKVVEKYGFSPEQIPDFKGLAGDASDNIPGVSGIGSKTASNLLIRYKTLENIYQHTEEIQPSIREKLLRERDMAFQSKDLGTIRTDSIESIDFGTCTFTLSEEVEDKVRSSFMQFGFFSLLERLKKFQSQKEVTSKRNIENGKKKKYRKIYLKEDWNELFENVKEVGKFSFMPLWGPGIARDNSIQGVGIFIPRIGGRYISWEKENEENIRALFTLKDIQKNTYNAKEVFHLFFNSNIPIENEKVYDILLAAYVLYGGGNLSLHHLLLSELGKEEELSHSQNTLFIAQKKEILTPPEQTVCFHAEGVFELLEVFEKKIQKESATDQKGSMRFILNNLELPLIRILVDMEQSGIGFDTNIFSQVSKKLDEDISKLCSVIYDYAGREFNINSTKQLREVLFEHLKLETKDIKKTKSGYSTASSELQKLKKTYPIAQKIEQYRELFKLKTTYVDVLPGLSGKDGRIRTTFNQAITATGRLSSSDPNLQNIPIRTELGKLLRTAFVAGEGNVLVGVDYSQIDLRCAAHVSGDKKMINAFLKGEDIHTTTASEVFGVEFSSVTPSMRRQAKVLNFGVLYGMGVFGFMNAAEVSRKEAQDFINSYKKKFSGLTEYLERIKQQTKERGYVETECGRRRYVPEIQSQNAQVVASGERIAINLPIQGLAADIMKLSMIASDSLIQKCYFGKIRMILQIHDELVFEVPETLVEKFSQEIKEVMQNVYTLHVPLVVDVAAGKNWSEI